MEEWPKPEYGFIPERVGELIFRSLRHDHMALPTIDDNDLPRTYIVPRQKAMAIGLSPDGDTTDEVDDHQLDKLLSNAVDPSLN